MRRIDAVDDGDLAGALAAALNGNEAGISVLWTVLQPGLLRYLRVVVGDAAEDVASETWLQAARDLGGFHGDAVAFRVWLFRIARNRAIDDRRRARRRVEDLIDPASQEAAVPGRDAELEALEGLGVEWALEVVASLPQDQAEAVLLRVIAGLDVAQTAHVLGKRPGAVRVAAMRGLRKLANHPQVLARAKLRAQEPGGRRALDAAGPKGV